MSSPQNKKKKFKSRRLHSQPIRQFNHQLTHHNKSRQNNFLLDCTNEIKSQLKNYNYMKDKYLSYFVVRLPKRIRQQDKPKISKQIKGQDLKKFIEKKRSKILMQSQSLVNLNHQNIDKNQLTQYEIINKQNDQHKNTVELQNKEQGKQALKNIRIKRFKKSASSILLQRFQYKTE